MDTSVTFTPKSVAAAPYVINRDQNRDTKVPVVERTEGAATLPANKPFVAQVVNARLSGTEFPDQPAEIVPDDRTLRPYGTPMLPHNGDVAAEQDVPADPQVDPDADQYMETADV